MIPVKKENTHHEKESHDDDQEDKKQNPPNCEDDRINLLKYSVENQKLALDKDTLKEENRTLRSLNSRLEEENKLIKEEMERLTTENSKMRQEKSEHISHLESEANALSDKYRKMMKEKHERDRGLEMFIREQKETTSKICSSATQELLKLFLSHAKKLEDEVGQSWAEGLEKLERKPSGTEEEHRSIVTFQENFTKDEIEGFHMNEKTTISEPPQKDFVSVEARATDKKVQGYEMLEQAEILSSTESTPSKAPSLRGIETADGKVTGTEIQRDVQSETTLCPRNRFSPFEGRMKETIFESHDGSIDHIFTSSLFGQRIFITASGNVVKITSLKDKRVLGTLKHFDAPISCLISLGFPGHNAVLVSGCYSKTSTIVFTCLRTFSKLCSFQCKSPIKKMCVRKEHGCFILACALSCGQIDLWDAEKRLKLSSLHGDKEEPVGIGTYHQGTENNFYLVTCGSFQQTIDIWCLERGREKVVYTLKVKCKRITSMCLYRAGTGPFVAVGTENFKDDHSVVIFKLSDRSCVSSIHSRYFEGSKFLKQVFFHGSTYFSSCCHQSRFIHLWDICKKSIVHTFDTKNEVVSFDKYYSGRESMIFAGFSDGKVIMYEIDHEKVSRREASNTPDRLHKRSRYE